jgi:L-lysine exporter family protein LysE/ArgO
MDVLQAFATGFAASAALIVAIGAQNAFVLRQGLARAHVGAVVAFCATADAVLIAIGVAGVGATIAASPALATAVTAGGAAFLAAYGARALHRAASPDALHAAGGAPMPSRRTVLAQAAAFTLLNPHVYLDTVLLLGTVGAQHPPGSRGAFVLGAACASVAWFGALGFGAARLAPFFARPGAWRALDAAVGTTLLALAAALALRLAAG